LQEGDSGKKGGGGEGRWGQIERGNTVKNSACASVPAKHCTGGNKILETREKKKKSTMTDVLEKKAGSRFYSRWESFEGRIHRAVDRGKRGCRTRMLEKGRLKKKRKEKNSRYNT